MLMLMLTMSRHSKSSWEEQHLEGKKDVGCGVKEGDGKEIRTLSIEERKRLQRQRLGDGMWGDGRNRVK